MNLYISREGALREAVRRAVAKGMSQEEMLKSIKSHPVIKRGQVLGYSVNLQGMKL